MNCPIPVMNDKAKEETEKYCVWVEPEDEFLKGLWHTECKRWYLKEKNYKECGCGKPIKILED